MEYSNFSMSNFPIYGLDHSIIWPLSDHMNSVMKSLTHPVVGSAQHGELQMDLQQQK